MRIPTTEQIRDLESKWIAHCDGNWGQVLMEIAGRGAAIRALRMWQENPGEVVVVAGRGNNGGDGMVVARYLTLWGVPVSVWLVSQARQKNESDDNTGSIKAANSLDAEKAITASDTTQKGSAKSATIERGVDVDVAEMKTAEGKLNKTILESLGVSVKVLAHEAFYLVERDIDDKHGRNLFEDEDAALFDRAKHEHKQPGERDSRHNRDEQGAESEHDRNSDPNVDELFEGASLIVDALFGTGLEKQVEGLYKRVIDAINRSGKRVLAIDVPSGINSDTGQIMGAAVRADQTVTFGYLKPGLVTHPGATLAGDLGIIDIGLPEIPESTPDINLMTVEIVREILPVRPVDSHKGSFGHVLAIAGSVGMAGAAMLSSMSALRVGAGLAFLATPRAVLSSLPAEEVIYKPMPETESGTFSKDAYAQLKTLTSQAQAIILGPGIGLNDDTFELVSKLLNDIDCPCIIDADGLNAIAKKPEILENNDGQFVLTPHPKELARLLDCEVSEIQSDRINMAIKAAQKFNAVIVLKGSMTVTANPEGEVFINPTGNAGMATAGAGDVLSGIIGGLLAQHVDPFQAAAAGAYIHGRSGDILAEEIDESGLVAGDIKRGIPFAIASIKNGQRSNLESMFLSESSD
ncbi:NAD(P)H-hydrate dehydratase [Candidatus Obscuribacterales bacterium]|nr:NAD(P)H-hydrate dehydratase [Candidatus Obscuribacterales bacterium]